MEMILYSFSFSFFEQIMIMILGLYKRIHIKKKKKLIIFHAWISQTGNFLLDDVGVFFFLEKIVILIRILKHENNI